MAGAGPLGLEQRAVERAGDVGGAQVGATETNVGGEGVTGGDVHGGAIGSDVGDAAVADRGHADVVFAVDGEGVEQLLTFEADQQSTTGALAVR